MLKKEFIKKLRLKLKTNYPSWCSAPKQLGHNIEFFFSKNDSSFSIDFDTPSSGKDKYHIQINLYVKNNNLYNVKNSISSKFHKNIYFGNYNLMPNLLIKMISFLIYMIQTMIIKLIILFRL